MESDPERVHLCVCRYHHDYHAGWTGRPAGHTVGSTCTAALRARSPGGWVAAVTVRYTSHAAALGGWTVERWQRHGCGYQLDLGVSSYTEPCTRADAWHPTKHW